MSSGASDPASDLASNAASTARATLDTWRERGADRVDPVRFHFIDALERRAARHGGEARRILDERLAGLLNEYAGHIERTASSTDDDGAHVANEPAAHSTLQSLVDYLASQDHVPVAIGLPRAASYPELPALDYFREVWSKVRTEKQMRQSLEQVPGNAGPLNSSSLVHRALSMMRVVSPGDLKQFLSYVDALSWMEQINSGTASAAKDTPRAGNAGKSARGKAR
jgi:hypothetical protein